ncbi:hypothetical protein AB1L42_23715, partial [Thalassoglobus sp. JC818]|uniref:hypothetical protein n=1 Tax=Thalassoglobus sp. JC818 TaxID=3232136 RepID=UPI00345978BF
ELSLEWPDRPTELAGGRVFFPSPEHPDVLVSLDYTRYPQREVVGILVERGENGIIRFDLVPSTELSLEYHPDGTRPKKFISGFGYESPPVEWVCQLDGAWYLVDYGD